ncbi:MAG: isochorismatase family protein [Nitrososphaeraceae archaeon]
MLSSVCVETSLREGFNTGYDVAIISDATASGDKRHYETTLERVRDYYGIVMDTEKFKEAVLKLDKMRKGEAKAFLDSQDKVNDFLKEFNLLDPRQFPAEQVNL